MNEMSRMQLIGFISATVHEVASRLNANYATRYTSSNGLLYIEIFKRYVDRSSFVIDLSSEDFAEKVLSISAQIQSTEL